MLKRYKRREPGKCIEPIKRLYKCLQKEHRNSDKCKQYRDELELCYGTITKISSTPTHMGP